MADSIAFLSTLVLLFVTKHTLSLQSYDQTNCNNTSTQPSSYLCNSDTIKCSTYVVYRPQLNQTLSQIATLFNVNETQLDPQTRFEAKEVLIPIACDCPDSSSRAIVTYQNTNSYPFSTIACQVYQGLVKSHVLGQQNAYNLYTKIVKVPIRCACANTSHEETNATRYLVTYPVMENDTVDLIALKFNVTPRSIEVVNGLSSFATIFADTTLIVPTTDVPVLNLNIVVTDHTPQEKIPVKEISKATTRRLFLFFLIIFFAIISFLGLLLLLIFITRKYDRREIEPLSIMGSKLNHFSPDFLDGMLTLKQSLTSFSLDELRLATQDFTEGSLIGKSVYKGRINGGFCVAIKDMMNSIESAHHVVYILTKINHFNVVKLEGCCFGLNKSYLVFEFVENGSLRDCLDDSKTRKQLTWVKRMQIAFDIAEGLHYIHYSTKPTYVHRNITTGNVLITADWRAKISGFNLARATAGEDSPEPVTVVGKKGYLAPEYVDCARSTSRKVDVYAYGVVLLELLSAKMVVAGGKWLTDGVGFLADGEVGRDSTACLEKFKGFMDGDLEGEYSFGDAMCLALLAKCCIQEDPENRPTMNDVIKTLSRMV